MYSIQLHLELNEKSEAYTVTSPDVPRLVTEGSTPEEIAHNVQEALDGLLEVWADLKIGYRFSGLNLRNLRNLRSYFHF